jgi:catecholate siderophore receptor
MSSFKAEAMRPTPYIRSSSTKPLRFLATTVGLAFVCGHAFAEDGPTADADQTAQKKAQSLQTIEVDANGVTPNSTKLTAPPINTPRTINTISASEIQATGSTTLQDSLRGVSGITFGAGEGGSPIGDIPYIRGFDSSNDIFIDGVRDGGAKSRETFDVEQIDVIKGPSSVYSGRGAAGGSVNITTKAPVLKDFSNIGVGVGSDGYRRATYDGNYMLGATTAARLDVMGQDAGMPGRQDVSGERSGIAPSISFGMGTANRLTVKYYHLYTYEIPDSGIPYNPTTGKPENVARDNFYGYLDRDFRKTHTDIGTVQFEHDFNEDWTLHETARYGRSSYNYIWSSPDDNKGNVADGLVNRVAKSRIGATNTAVNQLDLTGNFQTGSIQHNLAVGVEIEHDQTSVDQYAITLPAGITGTACTPAAIAAFVCTTVDSPNPHDPFLGSFAPANNPVETRTNTRSAYALDTLTFSEQWLANVGVRYDSYSTSANGINASVNSGPLGRFAIGNDANLWSGQAGLVYKPAANGSIYASWATSSSPSGLANGEGDQHVEPSLNAFNSLAPQKSKNLELGTKWALFDDHLSVGGAVFRAQTTNAVVQTSATTFELAGTKKVNGFEVNVGGNLTKAWDVYGGYTHLNPVLHSPGPMAAADGDGNQFPNVAKNSASVWSNYKLTKKLKFGLGIYSVSQQFGNAANTFLIPGYTRYDGMVAYKFNRTFDLQLNLQNITNKRYFTEAYAVAFAQQATARAAMLTANIHL